MLIVPRETETIIETYDGEIDGFIEKDQILATELGDLLVSHYPGYLWFVHVDSRPNVGMVYILNGLVSRNFGMKLKLSRVLSDPARKCVVMMAGELLERSGLPRGRHDGATVAKEIEGVPKKYQPGKI